MILTSKQIKNRLRDKWPDLQFIWPTNPFWTPVTDEWLEKIIINCNARGFNFIAGIWECENFTHRWKANVEEYQYKLYVSGEYKPRWRWPIAKCIGFQDDVFGNRITHGLNLIIKPDEVVLFEPQENKVLDESYKYEPFFMEF